MSVENAYEAALRSLPEAHSLVLRLKDSDQTDEAICTRLNIEPESLPTLLDVARRKLLSALRNVPL
jgi:hypothetical protein